MVMTSCMIIQVLMKKKKKNSEKISQSLQMFLKRDNFV